MQEYCHRCGEELAGDKAFCPHCGAPQLTLALEQQSVEAGGVSADGAESTGAMPPPRPRTVDWRVAIRCAAGVAAVGAALSLAAVKIDVLRPVTSLWGLCAAMIALGFYRKQQPAGRMDARIGARIGILTGLSLAVAIALALAAAGCVNRFVLHDMAGFDTQLAGEIGQAQQMADQWMASHSLPPSPEMAAYERTPEYRATYVLFQFAFSGGVLTVISAASGAFGGLLRTRRT